MNPHVITFIHEEDGVTIRCRCGMAVKCFPGLEGEVAIRHRYNTGQLGRYNRR